MTSFEINPQGNLVIRLLPEADKEELASQLAERGSDVVLYDVTEHVRCNSSWDFVDPADIGALTSAPILGEEVEQDDQGKITGTGRVFWYANYQVMCPVAELLEHGFVIFPGAPDNRPA